MIRSGQTFCNSQPNTCARAFQEAGAFQLREQINDSNVKIKGALTMFFKDLDKLGNKTFTTL
jgi:hypothetical protein